VIAIGSSVADVKPGTLALEGALAEFELARVEWSAAFRRADRVDAARALARLSQAACDLADPYGVNDALLPEGDGARAWFSDAIDRSLLASVVARSQRSMDPAALVVEASASRARIEAAVEAGDGASVAAIRCELLSRAATLVAITASGALRPVVPATPAFRISPEPLRGPLKMWVEIESASSARVELFDLAGRRVRTHELGNLPAGASTVRIPSDWSEGLPSGVYLARLSAGSMRNERRVTRLAD
jgi:hypothetical protein